jgi:hypothetical protein
MSLRKNREILHRMSNASKLLTTCRRRCQNRGWYVVRQGQAQLSKLDFASHGFENLTEWISRRDSSGDAPVHCRRGTGFDWIASFSEQPPSRDTTRPSNSRHHRVGVGGDRQVLHIVRFLRRKGRLLRNLGGQPRFAVGLSPPLSHYCILLQR